MKNIYQKNLSVKASQSDINVGLGLVQTLSVVQDNMCEFFNEIKCDGVHMVPVCNCFFVVSKTKVVLKNFAKWLDTFTITSEISSIGKIRMNLATEIVGDDGVIATCLQEMCPIDATERNIRMINTTLMPTDIEVTKLSDLSFSKLMEKFDEEDFVKQISVDVTNLDFYKHTNNIEYVKFMMSTLSLDWFENNQILDFEIHYISESRFGDELRIYRKINNDEICFQIVHNGNVITKALLHYKTI